MNNQLLGNTSEHSITQESLWFWETKLTDTNPSNDNSHNGNGNNTRNGRKKVNSSLASSLSAIPSVIPSAMEVTPTQSPNSSILYSNANMNANVTRGREMDQHHHLLLPPQLNLQQQRQSQLKPQTTSQTMQQSGELVYPSTFNRSANIPIIRNNYDATTDADRELEMCARMRDDQLYSRLVQGIRKQKQQKRKGRDSGNRLDGVGSLHSNESSSNLNGDANAGNNAPGSNLHNSLHNHHNSSSSLRDHNEECIQKIHKTRYSTPLDHHNDDESTGSFCDGTSGDEGISHDEHLLLQHQLQQTYITDAIPLDLHVNEESHYEDYWIHPHEDRSEDPSEDGDAFDLEL